MGERKSHSSAAGTEGVRRRPRPWRAFLVGLALVLGWWLPSSVGSAQTNGAQARACSRLQEALTRVGDRGSARQAVTSRLQRLGCATTGPTTTFGPTTTAVFPDSTTTSVHQDCVLPGGGIGPCPTTTTVAPGTTLPGGPTTTTLVPPTTLPSGPTTVAPTTTLAPCLSTTTSSTIFAPTTVPCAP